MNISTNKNKFDGFTIVELLVVIVVIGILATITTVAYGGIQNRAQLSKVQSDLINLEKAIQIARNQTGTVLALITLSFGTAGSCVNKATDTDLATLPRATDGCWISYDAALNRISIASGINVRGLVDPWGRPYWIDENENEGGPSCTKDTLGAYSRPFVTGWPAGRLVGSDKNVPNSVSGC